LTTLGAVFSTASQQSAFKYGQASRLTTLQQVPTQLAPAFIYLLVFRLSPLQWYSLPLLFAGTALMFISFYLLAGRKVEVSEEKKPTRVKEKKVH
jgi:ABC-type tungstate transport system substrate-binding protein